MDKMDKPASQNIEVHFTQTRNALEWKARVELATESFEIGPANIAALLNNIANLVRTECAYADLKVHGVLADAAAKPMTMREAKERREEKNRERAAATENKTAVLASEKEYGRDNNGHAPNCTWEWYEQRCNCKGKS